MVAAAAALLVPLLAAAIPAISTAVQNAQRPATPPVAPPAPAPAAPAMINDPRLTPAIQPMPQYALTPQGQMVQLPAQQQAALMQLAQQQQFAPAQQHSAQVARAQVNRTVGAVDPQLEQIRRELSHQALQTQATAEHRRIQQRKAFERQVLGRLGRIEYVQRISRY